MQKPPETDRPTDAATDEGAPVGTSASSVDPRHREKLGRVTRHMLGDSVDTRTPLCVWISGPPGGGRVALLSEVREAAEADGAHWVVGRAYPGTGEILEPILRGLRELLEGLSARADDDPEAAALWRRILDDRAPSLLRVLPEIPWGRKIPTAAELEPRFERSRLLDHIAGVVLEYATLYPLVLQVDGAEHLDGLSRDSLQLILRALRIRRNGVAAGLPVAAPPPIAVILVGGESDTPPVELSDDEVLSIPVRGLDRGAFVRLVEREYGAELPLSVVEKLYQLTHGNLYDLQARIAWEAADPENGGPEGRVKRLLEYGHFDSEIGRRVRALATPERRFLQALGVLGKPVSVTIIETMLDLARDEVAAMIGRLTGDGWIDCSEGRVVSLDHERLRDPIVDTLSEQQRRELHCRAADAIEREYEGRENRRFQEAYFHRARGPQDASATQAAFAGAEESLRLYDFDGAIAIYRDLLRMIGPGDIEGLERGLGSIAEALAETARVDEPLLVALEKMLAKSESSFEPTVRARLWRRLGEAAGRWGLDSMELGFFQRAYRNLADHGGSEERERVQAALARAFVERRRSDDGPNYHREDLDLVSLERLADDPEFLEICRATEDVQLGRDDSSGAVEQEERALKVALLEGNTVEQVECLLRLGQLHEKRDECAPARSRLLEAVPIARGSGSRLLEARALEQLGQLYAREEDWEPAAEAYRRAFEIQSEIGDDQRTTRLLGHLGLVSLALGDAEEGARAFRLFALYQQDRTSSEAAPPIPGYPPEYRSRSERDEEIHERWRKIEEGNLEPDRHCRYLLQLGDFHRDRGEMEKARRCLRDGLRIAVAEDLEPSRFHLRFGRLHRLTGDTVGALEQLQLGLQGMANQPAADRVAETTIQVGLLHADRGEFLKGLSFLGKGLRSYLELEHGSGVAHALIEISRVLAALGQTVAAEGLARAAITTCASLELARLEGEAWLALGAVRSLSGVGLEEIHAASEIFTELGILEARARVLYHEAELRGRTGDAAGSRALCSEAVEICRDLGIEPLLARCLALRGRMEGDHPKRFLTATRILDAALEHATRLGHRPLAVECHRTQAALFRARGTEPAARAHEQNAARIEAEIRAASPAHWRSVELPRPASVRTTESTPSTV